MVETLAPAAPQATVIPGADSLIGDLLDMDLGPPAYQAQQFQTQPTQPVGGGAMDLLGEGLDSLVSYLEMQCLVMILNLVRVFT